MSLPSDPLKISDLVRVTVDSNGEKTRNLMRRDVADAYIDARRQKPGFVSAKREAPIGLLKIGDDETLCFGRENTRVMVSEKITASTVELDRPVTDLAMLEVIRFGKSSTYRFFCMKEAIERNVNANTNADPSIMCITVNGKVIVKKSGILQFIETDTWTHPTMKAWMNRVAANYKRRRRILFAVGINPSTTRIARHVNGCNKFTPEAANDLRTRAGWKATFENFVCTCGHSNPTDEFAEPTAP